MLARTAGHRHPRQSRGGATLTALCLAARTGRGLRLRRTIGGSGLMPCAWFEEVVVKVKPLFGLSSRHQ
jgi:hypothetical protein